jgi:hypothetical protein
MTQPNPEAEITECLASTIVGFMLPFFLIAAAGNPDHARAAIRELINAYNASTPTELDLTGRIIGFSIAALDNLRLSMTPGLSDTKVLRYRGNAVTLSRASDRARTILEAVQAKRETTLKIPRPSIAPAPPAPIRLAALSKPVQPAFTPLPSGRPSTQSATDIETMKRDARLMMQVFSKNGPPGGASILSIPDPATLVKAATAQAMATARRTS